LLASARSGKDFCRVRRWRNLPAKVAVAAVLVAVEQVPQGLAQLAAAVSPAAQGKVMAQGNRVGLYLIRPCDRTLPALHILL
jgi:hypothetical protein